MSKMIDLTGQTFGYWKVLERGPNKPSGRAQWLCHCTLCDKTTKLVDGAHLRGGRSTSCGCTKMEKMRQASIKQEQGKTYGFLYVNRQATEEEKPRSDKQGIYWNCTCNKCGRTNVIVLGDYLRNGDTISCGCIHSKNESIIAQMLDNLNIKYRQQFRFNDLTSTGRACDQLLYDFAIFDATNTKLLYIIEYDGCQHFNAQHQWSEHGFEITRKNDLRKNKYCFEHHIPLIRIPYTETYGLSDLQITTTRFLLTPDNEDQYYNITK